MKGFGNRVREQRELRGWTPAQASREIGVSRQVIYRWESQPDTVPTLENLQRSARAFGVSEDYMAGKSDVSILESPLSIEAQELGRIYDKLPPEAQVELRGMASFIADKVNMDGSAKSSALDFLRRVRARLER